MNVVYSNQVDQVSYLRYSFQCTAAGLEEKVSNFKGGKHVGTTIPNDSDLWRRKNQTRTKSGVKSRGSKEFSDSVTLLVNSVGFDILLFVCF